MVTSRCILRLTTVVITILLPKDEQKEAVVHLLRSNDVEIFRPALKKSGYIKSTRRQKKHKYTNIEKHRSGERD